MAGRPVVVHYPQVQGPVPFSDLFAPAEAVTMDMWWQPQVLPIRLPVILFRGHLGPDALEIVERVIAVTRPRYEFGAYTAVRRGLR